MVTWTITANGFELTIADATLVVTDLTNAQDHGSHESEGGTLALVARDPATAFVNMVAAQLGYTVSGCRRSAKALPGLEGSIVIFSYIPLERLHAKLGIFDAKTEEQLELYLDVESHVATFKSKDEGYDADLISLFAYGLRDGNRSAKLSRRAVPMTTFEDILHVLRSESESDFDALKQALGEDPERFLPHIEPLIAALAAQRRTPVSVQRRKFLLDGKWMLGRLNHRKVVEEIALALSDSDQALRSDTLMSLGVNCMISNNFLDLPGVAEELISAVDSFIARFVMSDPTDVTQAIKVRNLLQKRVAR